jgi:FG-GAP-like repeat
MKHIVTLLLTLVLTACGGGGGGSSSPSVTNAVSSLHMVANLTGHSSVRNMVVGDLNNDGLDDVVIGGWSGRGVDTAITVLIQNADGTMADKTADMLPVSTYSGSQRLFIRDLDGDGRNDIFVPGFNDGCVGGCAVHSMIFWNQPGQFVQQILPELVDSHGACVDDINNDGLPDMLVRGVYNNGSTGGLYINNGNRTFTYSNNITAGAVCSVNHEPNGHITVLNGNPNAINTYDSNLTLLSSVAFASQDPAVTDASDSISIDVNNDGFKDFVIVFNSTTDNTVGREEVWLNDGAGHYAYSYTVKDHVRSYYHHNVMDVGGVTTVYISGANLQAELYQLRNGVFTEYKQNRFTEMAQQAGYYPGFTWSVDAGTVYQNRSTGKLYMLQLINGILYTQEL